MSELGTSTRGEELPDRESGGRNPFARIATFVRQVIGELRRVITPTTEELRRYTIIVVVFVLVVTAFVTGLDYGFGRLAGIVFGD